MQFPTGMHFNPDTARSEMLDFWKVLFSPVAANKFLHTIFSSYMLASLFVIAISGWYLLKGREKLLSLRSIIIAATFGLITSLFTAYTGDGSAFQVAQKQPAKLAAMEGLYNGEKGAGLIVFGILNKKDNDRDNDDVMMKIEIPKMLSILGYRNADAFVPGMNDLVKGNKENNIISAIEKINEGKIAIDAFAKYKDSKKTNDIKAQDSLRKVFAEHYKYIGYGYLNNPKSIIPNVPMTFYSFHIMVTLGFYFILFFLLILFFAIRQKLENRRLLLRIGIISFPLAFIASMAGWILAEVGRQPWAIQDLLPTIVATSNIDSSAVMLTFILFAVLFTILLIAEIKIMLSQIKSGPKGGSHV